MEIEQEYIQYLNRRTRPNTVKTYLASLRGWASWLNGRPPSQESAQVYLDILEAAGLSPNTVTTRANAIKKYFKWKRLPIYLDTPGVVIREPQYLPVVDLNSLVSGCKTPLEKALIYGLYDTACRISELLELGLGDVDRENGLLTITRKGGRRAQVNVSQKALTALDEWIAHRKSNSKRVFIDLTYWQAWKVIKLVGRRVKVTVRPHMFRHSRAVHMLESGADLHKVQMHLGHRSISTTADIYGQLRPLDLKKEIPAW